MAHISLPVLVSYLRRASKELGVPLSTAELAALAAIPWRESKYDSGAFNGNESTRDESWGLYQVNTRNELWSEYKELGLTSKSQLFDPYTNVKAAVLLVKKNRQYHGRTNGLWAWGPYKGLNATYGIDQSAIVAAASAAGGSGASGVEGGLMGGGNVSGGTTNSGNPIDKMLRWALTNALGKPYRFATSGPDSFDCSGLVAAMYRQIGISLPGYTRAAVKMGRHVDVNNLRPGDAIYTNGSVPPYGHVKIYLGNGLTIEAARTGENVKISKLNVGTITEVRRYVADSVANSALPTSGTSTVPGMSDTGPIVNEAPGVDPSLAIGPDLSNASDDEVRQYIKDNYGWMAGFLDDPEVGPMLMRAARENWSPAKIEGALEKTEWYSKRSAAQRQWDQLLVQDSGEASAQIAQRSADIIDMAGQLGVSLSAPQINELAQESLRSGWTNDQLHDTIIGNINWNAPAGTTMGTLQATASNMKALGKTYAMVIDDAQAQKWAVAINSGQLTPEGVEATLKQWAAARYPYIDTNKISPDDYFGPLKSAIGDELETPSTAIDITDPKWMGLLEVRDDKGELRSATTNEARLKARSDPRWVKTRKATDEGTAAANSVMKALTGTGMGLNG